MAYKSYEEQASEHIAFLRECGLDIDHLKLQSKRTDPFVACRESGSASSEKTLAYKTFMNPMNNGIYGLLTIARLKDRSQKIFKTYGSLAEMSHSNFLVSSTNKSEEALVLRHKDAAKKAKGFWECSLKVGVSDYLKRKCVGSYGIRFRVNEYGNVGVVPLRDVHGTLWSYQLLNADGTKIFAKDARFMGLFHALSAISNGKPIGIAESYVTAATCYELSGVSCVTAFSCENLQEVVSALREHYPLSPIIIFADNDRYSESNPGMSKAHGAARVISSVYVVGPDFGSVVPSRDASDWNDLMRLVGVEVARQQLAEKITAALGPV